MTGEDVLTATSPSKTFGAGRAGSRRRRVSAVDDVSVTLRRGESLGLVGESGCGRRHWHGGLERPDSGTVTLDNQDLTALHGHARRTARRRIQMIFQDPYLSLNPRLTVAELIAEPLIVHKLVASKAERADRVAELLQRVGLSPEVMHRFPYSFSGGQRQRIGIARALAAEPEVIICDEPVSALDLSVRAQILNLLRELKQRTSIALLFISHDLSVVRHVCDRTAVMYLGRLVEQGPVDLVHDQPAHPYTQALLFRRADRRSGRPWRPVPADPATRRPAQPVLPTLGLPVPYPLPSGYRGVQSPPTAAACPSRRRLLWSRGGLLSHRPGHGQSGLGVTGLTHTQRPCQPLGRREVPFQAGMCAARQICRRASGPDS